MVLVRITYPDGSFQDVPLALNDWNEVTKARMMQFQNAAGELPVSVEQIAGAT